MPIRYVRTSGSNHVGTQLDSIPNGIRYRIELKIFGCVISVKLRGKAGARALERDTALPKHRGYLLLTTESRANQRSRAGQAADVKCQG